MFGLLNVTKSISIPPLLQDFYKAFEKAGFKAYLVGGAVRDIFLRKEAHDWDVTTNATPQDVIGLFKFVVPNHFCGEVIGCAVARLHIACLAHF